MEQSEMSLKDTNVFTINSKGNIMKKLVLCISMLCINNIVATEFIIRPATPKDVSLVFEFIKEIAEYEKMSDEVVATEQDTYDALFGEHPYAHVILGFADDKPAGFAIYFYNFSTFLGKPGINLEDIFIRPAMRNKGLGTKMIAYLAKVAKEELGGKLEWRVLNWNSPAISFYKKIDATLLTDWTVCQLLGKERDALANLVD